MNGNWTLINGNQKIPCDSFPYAYRAMHGIVRKSMETGLVDKTIKQLSIVGPNMGKPRTYSYATATQQATATGLLTPDGNINSREFKRKY